MRTEQAEEMPGSEEGAAQKRRDSRWAPTFVLAIFLGAFLIFLVQPMVGKRILPWFGGAPSVWTLCLAFYQTTLFLGYAYAHLLIRGARPARQLAVHLVLCMAAAAVLPTVPGDAWRPDGVDSPKLDILKMLAANVALPFLVLAATGPLIQAWFARGFPGRSPFPLYAVSNFGSLAALLAYPFVVEPGLSLGATSRLWSLSFCLAALCTILCARVAMTGESAMDQLPDEDEGDCRHSLVEIAGWLTLSGSAVMILMGVTNALTLDIASVPFLWVLPLATYLLTFILAFASDRLHRPALVAPIAALALIAVFLPDVVGESLPHVWRAHAATVPYQIAAHCVLLFSACMLLHGELHAIRPPPAGLTGFYLWVAGGGALGGLFVGLLAPRIFDDYYELRLGLILGLATWVAVLARAPDRMREHRPRRGLGGSAPFVAVALCAALLWPRAFRAEGQVFKERGFFGVLRVVEVGEGAARQRRLASGSTMHGVQFVHPAGRRLATSYYGRATGIGLLLGAPDRRAPLRVGLVGLGAGTLATYGRAGDLYRYYEIDPVVVRIARESGHFTFLAESEADVEVVIADGRLAIEDEQSRGGPQGFDLLVVDAFTSDAIPIHLLTLEAFEAYRTAIAADGLLALHISNRHFELAPIIARVGREIGLESLDVVTGPAPSHQSQPARWILLSEGGGRLSALGRQLVQRSGALGLGAGHLSARGVPLRTIDAAPLWTDDYSDLFGALKARGILAPR